MVASPKNKIDSFTLLYSCIDYRRRVMHVNYEIVNQWTRVSEARSKEADCALTVRQMKNTCRFPDSLSSLLYSVYSGSRTGRARDIHECLDAAERKPQPTTEGGKCEGERGGVEGVAIRESTGEQRP